MASTVIDIKCPGCGAAVSTGQEICEYCNRPIVISTFNSVASMTPLELNKYANSYRKTLTEHPDNISLNISVAICYLKLKMFDEAYAAFSKAIAENFDNSETYFYAAACLLKGKKAFLHTRPEIDKMLELLNSAISIEPKGIYFYFMAYIKYDYFKRKFLNTTPNYRDCLSQANALGFTRYDMDEFYSMTGIDPITFN